METKFIMIAIYAIDHSELQTSKTMSNVYYLFLSDQMETVANWYENPDKFYVETHAFRQCKEILNDKHWVTILGYPGDGKSMMAAHLMSQYRNRGFNLSLFRQYRIGKP